MRALTGRALPNLLMARLLFVSTSANSAVQLTPLLLQFVGVTALGAEPGQLGALAALYYVPALLVTPFGATLVERLEKRATLSLLALYGVAVLSALAIVQVRSGPAIEQLYVVALALGVVTATWPVAMSPFVVRTVGRPRLLEANSQLLLATGVARTGAPMLAGVLTATVMVPVTFLANAVLFAFALVGLRTFAPVSAAQGAQARNYWRELREGWRTVASDSALRALIAYTGTYNFAAQISGTVLILFATRELRLSPEAIGAALAIGQAGWFLGPLIAPRLARRMQIGRSLLALIIGDAMTALLLPLTPVTDAPAAVWIGAVLFLHSLLFSAAATQGNTLRQLVTPDPLLGRVAAAFVIVGLGVVPPAGVVGGAIGGLLGLRPTLLIGALAMQATWLWILGSRIPRIAQDEAKA